MNTVLIGKWAVLSMKMNSPCPMYAVNKVSACSNAKELWKGLWTQTSISFYWNSYYYHKPPNKTGFPERISTDGYQYFSITAITVTIEYALNIAVKCIDAEIITLKLMWNWRIAWCTATCTKLVHNAQCMYMQNDYIHKFAAVQKKG